MSTASLESFLARYMSAPLPTQQRVLEAAHAALDGGGLDNLAGPGLALTISAAARRAGVSRGVIYSAIASGELRAAPLYRGGRRRIVEEVFAAWMRRGASA